MDVITSQRNALKWAAELLEMIMDDVTDELAHWEPPGTANPLGATYAHSLTGLDAVVNILLQGQKPLFETSWAGKTGISKPQWLNEINWARSVRLDLPAVREYAQVVYANTDNYIASLSISDLAREIDLSHIGLGVRTLNWCLNALIIGHTNNMAGEISVLKGVQGAMGYPH